MKQITTERKPVRRTWWFKLKLILWLIWLLSWLALYWWGRSLVASQNRVYQSQTLLERLGQQQQYCDQLLTSQSGEFGEYEYCRRLKERFGVNMKE